MARWCSSAHAAAFARAPNLVHAAEGDFADLKKTLNAELGAFRCSNGQFHDTKTKKCGPSMIHLKVRKPPLSLDFVAS